MKIGRIPDATLISGLKITISDIRETTIVIDKVEEEAKEIDRFLEQLSTVPASASSDENNVFI